MSLENGILGYLLIKPLSGYDIKKLFNMTAAYFWPADQAQIYRALKKLVEEGSVELAKQEQGKTVDRKVYTITDKGQEALIAWVSSPTETDFISRLPFIMKLFFSGSLNKAEQLVFLDKQQEINNKLIQKLHQNYNKNRKEFAKTAEVSESDSRFESAVYAYRWGILRGEAYGKLLEDIKSEIISKKD